MVIHQYIIVNMLNMLKENMTVVGSQDVRPMIEQFRSLDNLMLVCVLDIPRSYITPWIVRCCRAPIIISHGTFHILANP